jgi:hypothetical protein
MANEKYMPWAVVNCDYNGAICIAAPLYWWNVLVAPVVPGYWCKRKEKMTKMFCFD